MIGIISYSVYIPLWRMDRKLFGTRGEKPIGNFDEDSVTMAVSAATNCLKGIERTSVNKVFFASTTFPYKEKQGASIIAAACDLPHSIATADFANSLKGGSSALLSAVDAVAAKNSSQVLVAVADMRLGIPMGEFERISGDGAAAFLIGDSEVAASIECTHSISEEAMDTWRTQNDTFVRSWESRFIGVAVYEKIGEEVIAGLLKKCDMKPKDFSKIVFYAPDSASPRRLAKKMGFDPETQLQDPFFNVLGNTGAPYVLMQLTAALDESKPGDFILLFGYGDGADAVVLRVTEQIENISGQKRFKKYLDSKKMINDYRTYLLYRGLLSREYEKVYSSNFQENTSVPAMWRERNRIFRLYGVRCRACGTIQFPPQRVCTKCRALDQFEEVRLSDKEGTVFTFSMDYTSVVDNPTVIPIVDFDGGGRGEFYMTDRSPEEVKIDMRVEMTFRKLFFDEGIYHYYWKAMPVRIL